MGWVRRLRSTFSRTAGDFDEERRFHIDERTDEYVRNGMSREEARRAALKRFGNATLAKERTLDVDVFRWIEDLHRDTGYALRMLWRSPGFTVLAIVCLTLGIGANVAVFSWIEGILLRPYPLVVDQDRLFAVTGTNRGAPGHTDVSWPDWLDLQRASTLAEAFIGEKITGTTLSIGDRAERASGSMVSANYFDAIGVRPVLGRSFEPGEDSGRNAHPVTVISYEMWRDRFHGDPGVIGKTQVLSGLPHTIVGVAPKGFYGTFVGYAFQFWVPASMQSQFDAGVYKLEDRGARWIEGYVRLKPGVTIEQAQAEMSAIAARLEADYPETNRGRGVKLFPLWQTPFNNAGALLPTLAGALRSESGGVIGGRSRASVRSTLVLVQVSLSFVLLVGAGLLIQSLQAVRNASPGFSTDGVLTTGVDLFTAGYDPQRAKNFQDELIDRLQALGGVESAALSRMTPFSYRNYSTAPIAVDGYDAPPDQQPAADYNEIGPGFLATMGIPLLSGREFTRADNETAPLVAVVDETMAAQFWRGVDPVGRRVQVKGRWMQIVGLARNARYRNLLETPKPFFYVALRHNFSATTALQLRTAQRPAALAPALVREIHALDANVAPSELITMREQVDRTTAAQRISVTILVVFGALALVLAAIGLYGVMASTVSQSSRELALRMALGAGASDLLGLVLSQGLALTAGGVVVGLVAALQVTRLLGYLLYKVSPRDPLAFASAFVVIAVASLVACFVPAWRAVRTDPLRALRG